jgi:hypothetical protein
LRPAWRHGLTYGATAHVARLWGGRQEVGIDNEHKQA